MKELILKSNRYIHYKVKVTSLLVLCFVLTAIVETLYSLMIIKMQLRKNIEKHELYRGVVTANNAYKKHTFHHTITVSIP